MDWTEDQAAELKRLWTETTLSTAAIGREMGGLSKNMIVGNAHRLGLPARPSPIKRGDAAAPARPVARGVPTLPRLAAPVPAAPPVPTAPPVPVAAHPLVRLGGGCRWPIGEPGTKGFRLCDDPAVVRGKPYCAEHCALAYAKPVVSAAAMAPRGWVA